MDKMIARLNVENFRALIGKETDDAKRRILLSLLAAEEAKLAALPNVVKRAPYQQVRSDGAKPDLERHNGGGYAAKNTPWSELVRDWRLDAALANVPHGLCIFDSRRRLLLSNSRYAEMYRLPSDLLIPGTPLESIVAYRQRIGNAPVDFPSYASHDGIEFNREGNSIFEVKLQDGRTIRINHLVLQSGGYVATHEDISDAVRSEERFRSIFEAVGEGIFIFDATTRTLIEINEPGCLMLGCTAAELTGSDIRALSSGVSPYTRHGAEEWITKAAASGLPQRFAWQCKTKAGRLFPVEISMRFASISGRPVVLAIVLDLTEREAFEAHLRQSQRAEVIARLADRMTHDFNALVGVIIGKLELLRDAYPSDQRIAELAGEALEAALRCESYASVAGFQPRPDVPSAARPPPGRRPA